MKSDNVYRSNCQNLFAVPMSISTFCEWLSGITGEGITYTDGGHKARIGKHGASSSLAVTEQDGGIVWYDHSASQGGGVIEAIMEYEGITDRVQAARRGWEIAGFEPPTTSTTSTTSTKQAFLTEGILARAHEGMQSQEWLNFIAQRGIPTDPHLEHIGWWLSTWDAVQIPSGPCIPPRSLVVWNEGMTWVKVIPMDADGHRDRAEGRNVRQTAGKKGAHWEPRTLEASSPVFLTEGETSTLALWAIGLQSIPCKPEGDGKRFIESLVRQGLKVVYAYDNDEAGKDFTTKAQAIHRGTDISPLFDAGADPNDFTANGGTADAIANYIAQAEDKARAYAVLEPYRLKNGRFSNEQKAVHIAVQSDLVPVEMAFDYFTNRVVWRPTALAKELYPDEFAPYSTTEWNGNLDLLITEIACVLGIIGVWGVSRDKIRSAVYRKAELHHINSFADFIETKGKWEEVEGGTPADAERFLADFFECYCGYTGDHRVSRATALHMLSAMYGRATCRDPQGVKCDIITVIVGKTGIRKTELLRALSYDHISTLPLRGGNETRCRAMQGKAIMEIAEANSHKKADRDDEKDFLSQKKDSWVPKYVESETESPRTCSFVMTSNEGALLSDPTGSRRFAPITIPDGASFDLERVYKDRDKIWRASRCIYETKLARERELGLAQPSGIYWQDVEAVQKWNNRLYEDTDILFDEIREWIITNKIRIIKSANVIADHCLLLNDGQKTNMLKARINDCLMRLGAYRAQYWGKAEDIEPDNFSHLVAGKNNGICWIIPELKDEEAEAVEQYHAEHPTPKPPQPAHNEDPQYNPFGEDFPSPYYELSPEMQALFNEPIDNSNFKK